MENKVHALICFGTTDKEALKRTLSKVCNSHENYRLGFSSEMVLSRTHYENVYGLEELFYDLKSRGVKNVEVSSLFIIPGEEYSKLLEIIDRYKTDMDIIVSEPLMTRQEDIIEVADAIIKYLKTIPEEQILLIGHGSPNNEAYTKLGDVLKDKGSIIVSTLEGSPNIYDEIDHLTLDKNKPVNILPLFLFGGHHVKEDISEGDGSLKTLLEEKGYKVRLSEKVCGELESFHQMFQNRMNRCYEGQ